MVSKNLFLPSNKQKHYSVKLSHKVEQTPPKNQQEAPKDEQKYKTQNIEPGPDESESGIFPYEKNPRRFMERSLFELLSCGLASVSYGGCNKNYILNKELNLSVSISDLCNMLIHSDIFYDCASEDSNNMQTAQRNNILDLPITPLESQI